MAEDCCCNNKTYVLELSRWNVKNDGTDSVNTTKGINEAMNWSIANGYAEFLLPKGLYLIDKDSRIEPPSYLTLNLNGSTLKKEQNGYENYAVISFRRNQKYSRVTNGVIQGDRQLHDYITTKGTHEGGYGIEFGSFSVATGDGEIGNNAKFIKVDNVEILDCTGDCINFISDFGQISPYPLEIANSWEQGSINPTTGSLENNTNKIRSKLKISMMQSRIVKFGYFGLYGNGYGALGSDIKTDYYDVFFYKSDNNFLSVVPLVQFFEEVEVPEGADHARVMLHQSIVPTPENCLINVRTTSFPSFIFVENCDLHHSRRQGISVCGAKNIYIRDNDIHHIGGSTNSTGTSPMSGIDIEDGYDLNQYIHIDYNNFHHNERYNLITVNGKNIHITNNTFMSTNVQGYVSLAINGGTDKVIVKGNIIKLSKVSLVGEVLFSDNYIFGTQVTVNPVYDSRAINVNNNVFHNCKYVFDSPFPFLISTVNCRFINDAEKVNNAFGIGWTIEFKNKPQTITNCQFEGQDFSYLSYSTLNTYVGGWVFEDCRFKNTKLPTLYSGVYKGCTFTDVNNIIGVTSKTGGTDSLELINCKIYSTDTNNTLLTFNSLKSLKIINCHIEKTSGWLIKIGNISDEVILSNNTFKITNDLLNRSVINLDSTFVGKLLLVENNIISCTNSTRTGIDNLTTGGSTVVIRGNILTKSTINRNGKEITHNNIIDGVVETVI